MKLDEIIKNAKTASPNQEIHDLVQQFEEFHELYRMRHSINKDDFEELDAFTKKLDGMKQRLNASVTRVAASYGLTLEQLHAYVEDPKNFTQTSWGEIQTARRQIETQLDIPAPMLRKRPRVRSSKHLKI